MARLGVLLMAVFISAIALEQSFVNAKFSKSIFFNSGGNSMSAILGDGDDLQLVLDRMAGKIICFSSIYNIAFQHFAFYLRQLSVLVSGGRVYSAHGSIYIIT